MNPRSYELIKKILSVSAARSDFSALGLASFKVVSPSHLFINAKFNPASLTFTEMLVCQFNFEVTTLTMLSLCPSFVIFPSALLFVCLPFFISLSVSLEIYISLHHFSLFEMSQL